MTSIWWWWLASLLPFHSLFSYDENRLQSSSPSIHKIIYIFSILMCKDAWENFSSLCRSVCVIFSMENGQGKNGWVEKKERKVRGDEKCWKYFHTWILRLFHWCLNCLCTFHFYRCLEEGSKNKIYDLSFKHCDDSYIGSENEKASMYAVVVWMEWKSWQPRNYTWDFSSHSSNFISNSSYLLCSNLMTFPAGIFIIYHFLHANTIFSLSSHICSKPETLEHMERECENLWADN